MDKVFRVAHRDRIEIGCYRGHPYAPDIYEYTSGNRHPLPYEDSKLSQFYETYDGEGYLFGFKSKEQASMWFYHKDMRDSLSDAGYVVYEMDMSPYSTRGEDYEYGDTQAMFNLGCADCVAVHEINDFFS